LPKKSSKVAVERDGDNAFSPLLILIYGSITQKRSQHSWASAEGGKTGISPLEILGLRSKNF